jgi:hypothetical protein
VFLRREVLAAIALAALLFGWRGELLAQQSPTPAGSPQAPPPAPKPEWTDIPLQPPAGTPAAAAADPSLPEIKFPNFISCPIAEIQLAVPELAHLKAAQDQSQLVALLERVGAKTVEIVRTTPNLASHETVVSEQNGFTTHSDYSFLILQHAMGTKSRVFDEYRVDVATGEKLETDFIEKAAESAAAPAPPSLADVTPAAPILPHPAQTGPNSQGFVSAWLDFYPANRKQFAFRYLGQQKMDRRQTLVVAFAQKPASVPLPALVEYNQKTYKIFMQGVAWIDPAEFRILRLRSDLLSVPAGLPLHQMSVDIHFAQMSIVDVPSPLWLPTQAVITSNLNGSILRERHTYSNYRLFRTRSRIVLK